MAQERFFLHDGKVMRRKTSDPTAALESAKALRSAGKTGFSENKHVARIDRHLVEKWAKEAGIDFSDREAMNDMFRKKLLSNEFRDLRVWEGTY